MSVNFENLSVNLGKFSKSPCEILCFVNILLPVRICIVQVSFDVVAVTEGFSFCCLHASALCDFL